MAAEATDGAPPEEGDAPAAAGGDEGRAAGDEGGQTDGASSEQTRDKKRRSNRKKGKRRREAEERVRVDAAMKLLDDAREKAQAEKAEYGKYLAWKVAMQRKERVQRLKDEAGRMEHMERNLVEVLHEHRQQVALEKTRWRQYASNRASTRKKVAEREAEGDARHETYLKEKQSKRLQYREQVALSAANRQHHKGAVAVQGGGADSASAAQVASSLASRASYEDFQKMLRDDTHHRKGIASDSEVDQMRLMASKTKRESRETKVAQMYELATHRREAAMLMMQRDPPAECILSHDVTKYLPPEFKRQIQCEMEVSMTGLPRKRSRSKEAKAAGAAQGSQFFLTAVGDVAAPAAPPPAEDGEHDADARDGHGTLVAAGEAPGQKNAVTTAAAVCPPMWMTRLPQPPPICLPINASKRARQDRERAHLESYLTDVQKGYFRPHNRTEYHGKEYTWTRQFRHHLPVAMKFALTELPKL